MDHDFFSRFYPRIVEVLYRDESFWKRVNYDVNRLQLKTKTFNILFVTNGSGYYWLDDQKYELRRGNLFHFSPGSALRLLSSRENPLQYYSVNYDYRFIKWEGTTVYTSESMIGLSFPAMSFIPEISLLQSSFDSLHKLWDKKDRGYEWLARLGFQQLLIEVDQALRMLDKAEDHIGQIITQSEQYIKDNYDKSLDREELAARASLSLSYYSIMFKKWTGYSPLKYIHNVRIEQAKRLLRSGNMKISEVAREVGFEDPLYFARIFTKKTGLSPRDYRKV